MENAFGRLKARWRRLLKRLDVDANKVPNIVIACCILHNICEIHGDAFHESWLEEVDDSQQPCGNTIDDWSTSSDEPKEIRNTLVKYFSK